MPESLLTILKFLLMALLYLFFLRVLRAVWAEVNAPRVATAPAGSAARGAPRDRRAVTSGPKGTPNRLRVVEPAQQRGHTYDLGEEMTVGRAAGCQVKVDDTYASQLHARVFRKDGQVFVEDLGSTNGTYVNRKGTQNKEKVSGPMPLRLGDRLMVGRTVLEVAR
ncbi:MAG TPA: FHA domain-containing protein [Acidimicrobiales bacterium]|nr:FHA domain-containing protein [Acidimicrobiales bacterium]